MPSKFRLRYIFRPLINKLAKILGRIGLSPNYATFLMLILSFFCFIFLAILKIEWLFGIFVFLVGIFDGVDGAIARLLKKESKFGGFLDSIADRFSEIIIFLAILLYFENQKFWNLIEINFIIYISLGASLLISYARTRAQNISPGDFDIGLMGRSERLFFISISSILGWLWECLPIFMILTVSTAIFRLVKAYSIIKKEEFLKSNSNSKF